MALVWLSLLLIACGSGGGSSSAESANNIIGAAVKGTISGGIINAYSIDPATQNRTFLARTTTDENGDFSLALTQSSDELFVLVEIESDEDTRMRCDLTDGCENSSGQVFAFGQNMPIDRDFSLQGVVHQKYAYISATSHLAVATATLLPGGLTKSNFYHAEAWIQQAFDLDSNWLSIKPADITSVSNFSSIDLDELSLGIWNATFLELSQSADWNNLAVSLNDIPMADLYALAIEIANDLDDLTGSSQARIAAFSHSASSALSSLNQKLEIISQPQDLSANEGESVHLHVLVSETSDVQYQWFKAGSPIDGANDAYLSFPSVEKDDEGSYTVVATKGIEVVESFSVTINVHKVIEPLVITSQPQSQTAGPNGGIVLTVGANGEAPISYQWLKGGSILPGETQSSLSLNASTSDLSGAYRVLVSNPYEEIYSNSATITVNNEISPIQITTQPTDKTVPAGITAEFSVEANGSGYIAYQWLLNGQTILDATSSTLTIQDASIGDSGNYSVTLTNSQGSVTSDTATLTVLSGTTPISITQHPQPKSVHEGESASFSIVAQGSSTLGYQWKKDGAILNGQNSSTLNISYASPEDAGSYSVIVSNGSTSEESIAAALEVQSFTQLTLSWNIPTTREDGEPLPLNEIGGYIIEYGSAMNALTNQVVINDGTISSYTLTNLQSGDLYLRMATEDIEGNVGTFSGIARISLP